MLVRLSTDYCEHLWWTPCADLRDTSVELIIKTAKAIGLSPPLSLLGCTDVIDTEATRHSVKARELATVGYTLYLPKAIREG